MQVGVAKVGMVVQLMSGGPVMTVGIVGPDEQTKIEAALCYWIDANGRARSFPFPTSCLAKYPKEKTAP